MWGSIQIRTVKTSKKQYQLDSFLMGNCVCLECLPHTPPDFNRKFSNIANMSRFIPKFYDRDQDAFYSLFEISLRIEHGMIWSEHFFCRLFKWARYKRLILLYRNHNKKYIMLKKKRCIKHMNLSQKPNDVALDVGEMGKTNQRRNRKRINGSLLCLCRSEYFWGIVWSNGIRTI